jgi:hypothetical protein
MKYNKIFAMTKPLGSLQTNKRRTHPCKWKKRKKKKNARECSSLLKLNWSLSLKFNDEATKKKKTNKQIKVEKMW